MSPFLDGQVVLAVLALTLLVVPAAMASVYYAKQTFWPPRNRDDGFMSRAEVQRELARVDVRINDLAARVESMANRNDSRHEELFRALSNLRVEIGRLTTLLEGRLNTPFRDQEKR